MESRRIVIGALLIAAVLALLWTWPVLSCMSDDFDTCEFVRQPIRIGDLHLKELAANQKELKASLLEFANVSRIVRFGQNLDAESELKLLEPPRVLKPRTPDRLYLRQMASWELEREVNRIYARQPEESRNRAHLLARLAAEQQRRVDLAAQARKLALLKQFTVKAVPKPVDAPHIPGPAKPGSADPFNAPAPSGSWFHIGPHTSVWYNISDRGRRLNIWMDTDQNSGLIMAVYGADIQDVWTQRPTGQGAPGEGHAYFWTGRSRFKGVWRIRITNPNDFSVPYNLAGANISDKNGDLCRDCHGGSIDDEWDKCEHDGSFCQDLKDEYAN